MTSPAFPTADGNDRGLVISLQFDLGQAVGALLPGQMDGGSELARAVHSTVTSVLADMGIPGVAAIEVVAQGIDPRLRLFVGGRFRAVSDELLAQMWNRDRKKGQLIIPAERFTASVVAPNTNVDLAGEPGRLIHAIVLAVEDLVRQNPADLLSDVATDAMVRNGSRTLQPSATSALVALGPVRLAKILRNVLSSGVSLRGPQRLSDLAALAAKLDPSDADGTTDLSEQFTASCAEPIIRVDVSPGYLAFLLQNPEQRPFGFLGVSRTRRDGRLPKEADERIGSFRDEVLGDLGVRLPPIVLEANTMLTATNLRVVVNGRIAFPVEGPGSEEVFVERSVVDPWPPAPDPRPITTLARSAEVVAVPRRLRESLEQRGYRVHTPWSFLVDCVRAEVYRGAWRLVNLASVQDDLARFAQIGDEARALVLDVLVRTPTWLVARVMRALVREGVSVLDLPTILERLALFDSVDADTRNLRVFDDRLVVDQRLVGLPGARETDLVSYVRLGLRRAIVHRAKREGDTVHVFTLKPSLEEALLGHVAAVRGNRSATRLNPDALDDVAALIRRHVARAVFGAWRPAILAPGDIRSLVRELIADDLPAVMVLSYGEVDGAGGIVFSATDEIGA